MAAPIPGAVARELACWRNRWAAAVAYGAGTGSDSGTGARLRFHRAPVSNVLLSQLGKKWTDSASRLQRQMPRRGKFLGAIIRGGQGQPQGQRGSRMGILA